MADPARLLGGLRTAVGVGSWLVPAVSARTFGTPAAGAHVDGRLLLRLFGVRDGVLGAGALSRDPRTRQQALRAGLVCDLTDAAATGLALRDGASRAAGVGVGLGALLFAGLGAWALRQEAA